MGDVIQFPDRKNSIYITGNHALTVETHKVSFPWAEVIEMGGKTYRVNATIDVQELPQRLHYAILHMIRTQVVLVPSEHRVCVPRKPEPKKPWWRFW